MILESRHLDIFPNMTETVREWVEILLLSDNDVSGPPDEPTTSGIHRLSAKECQIFIYIRSDVASLFISDLYLYQIWCHIFIYIRSGVTSLFISDLVSHLYLYQIWCQIFIYIRSGVTSLFISDPVSHLYLYCKLASLVSIVINRFIINHDPQS